MSLDEYEYMCPHDLSAVARGYELRQKTEWSRTLLLVNCWTKEPVSYEDLMRGKTTKNAIRSKEEWEKFKQKKLGKSNG